MERQLKNISTKELVSELRNRIGVEVTNINPYDLIVENLYGKLKDQTGPAIVLVIID